MVFYGMVQGCYAVRSIYTIKCPAYSFYSHDVHISPRAHLFDEKMSSDTLNNYPCYTNIIKMFYNQYSLYLSVSARTVISQFSGRYSPLRLLKSQVVFILKLFCELSPRGR